MSKQIQQNLKASPDKTRDRALRERPPIVVIMGHIDHGKSTLLDYIRKTNTTAKEAGGITQHIAAYEIEHAAKRITFLDTPGHQAFTEMRSRGARAADIAVLVVSAEEGVKAQTIEALEAIIRSKTPYLIAINKIDRPNADIERTKQSLAENNIYIEGYGGTVSWVALSAKTGTGVPELLDMILLMAELAALEGDPYKDATGYVIESSRDPKRGISAVLVITDGTLKKGMFVAAESSSAPVRRIEDFAGRALAEATFSAPVRISGWDRLPNAGALFTAYSSKKQAEVSIAAWKEKMDESRQHSLPPEASPSAARMGEAGIAVIPLIIKADTLGTLEAAIHQSKKLENERIVINVIGSGVGSINESDIKLASGGATRALIAGFNVKLDESAQDIAARYGIEVGTFDIIYALTEWLESRFAGRIPAITVEETVGTAKILRVFSRTRDKHIVGGRVLGGRIVSGGKVKIMRREYEIDRGNLIELQQQKVRTKEATAGEFGALIECKHEIAPGDTIEAIELVTK